MEDDVFMSLDNACISFRIGTPVWLPEARFSGLMALFEKYKGITDEVTFFTAETHPCLPLIVLQERAKLLARRMDQVRKMWSPRRISPPAVGDGVQCAPDVRRAARRI